MNKDLVLEDMLATAAHESRKDVKTGFIWSATYTNPDGTPGWEIPPTHNLVTIEGLNHIAGTVFKGAAQATTWYVAPFEGNYTPQPTDTAATIATASTECTAYAETTRVEFNEGNVANGSVDNTLNKAVLTFTANKTLYGGFLISASPKAGTTGTLMSVVRFPSPKIAETGGVLNIVTGVAFASL